MTTIAGRIATMTSATVIMLALLTGCVPAIPSPHDEEPPMSATLESAKQETVLLRDEIVALLPSDAVGEVRLVNEATLFDCTPAIIRGLAAQPSSPRARGTVRRTCALFWRRSIRARGGPRPTRSSPSRW